MTNRRTDSRIDQMDFPDTGCHLHASCLRCPRERCYLDEPVERVQKRPRAAAVQVWPLLPAEVPARSLTYREAHVLHVLWCAGKPLTAAEIGQLAGCEGPVSRAHMSELRRKGVPIRTIRGVGYALEVGA